MFSRDALLSFSAAKKDALYDLLNRENIDWRKLQLLTAKKVLKSNFHGDLSAFLINDSVKIRRGKMMPGISSQVPIASQNGSNIANLGTNLDQSVGGIALFIFCADYYMSAKGVQEVMLKSNPSVSMIESIKNSMVAQGAAVIENLAKLARKDLDAIIARNAARVVNHLGGNTSAMSSAATNTVRSGAGVRGLAVAKSLVKIGGILGVIDVTANSVQSYRLYGRGDYDAAAYAATGAIGGIAMKNFTLANNQILVSAAQYLMIRILHFWKISHICKNHNTKLRQQLGLQRNSIDN